MTRCVLNYHADAAVPLLSAPAVADFGRRGIKIGSHGMTHPTYVGNDRFTPGRKILADVRS